MPSGNPVAKTTVETLFVIEGEPQPALFEWPPGYKERAPSELADEYARRFGVRPFSDQGLRGAEEKYQALHEK